MSSPAMCPPLLLNAMALTATKTFCVLHKFPGQEQLESPAAGFYALFDDVSVDVQLRRRLDITKAAEVAEEDGHALVLGKLLQRFAQHAGDFVLRAARRFSDGRL